MRHLAALSLLIFAYVILIPMPAHAYLLPLIGATGAIVTMFIGIITALFCAIYLVFYNIRRSFKRRLKGDTSDDESDEGTDDTQSPT